MLEHQRLGVDVWGGQHRRRAFVCGIVGLSLLADGCADSHHATARASSDAAATASGRDGAGADASSSPSSRVLDTGAADFIDVFVFEAGLAFVHSDGVRTLGRDGVEIDRWTAPARVISTVASDDAIAVVVEEVPGAAEVVVLTSDLRVLATYPVWAWVRDVELVNEWLLVSAEDIYVSGELYRVPDLGVVARPAVGYPAPSVGCAGPDLLATVQYGSIGTMSETRHFYTGLALDSVGSGGLDPRGLATGTAVDRESASYREPPRVLAFTGPSATHVVVGNGDVFAVDVGTCAGSECVTFLGATTELGALAMGSARAGATSSVFALASGLRDVVRSARFCDPDDVLGVAGAPRCRLVRIDPDVDAPVWSVDWNRPVVAVPAVEHDPWANAVVVATYAEWASPGVPRGWVVEIVDLPAP